MPTREIKVAHVLKSRRFFEVLQTAGRTQTAAMTLAPGQATGPMSNEHPKSDQVLLVLAGQVTAQIGNRRRTLKRGDSLIVPAGVRHRFVNRSTRPAKTFNVYGPPAYGRDEKE